MRIGLLLSLFSEQTLNELLPYLVSKEISAIELYTGPLSDNTRHCDSFRLLTDKAALREYKSMIKGYGMIISAINVSGNPIHPVESIAKKHDESLKQGLRLAEALEVDRIISFSGCPGGAPSDTTPNWVCCPWPEEYLDIINYQWNDVLIPYWHKTTEIARTHGVTKIAIEMHPGFCVYNTDTLLKLRSHVGNTIGANLDPSHLMWQGVKAYAAVAALGDAIYHVHIKDVRLNQSVIDRTGVIDAKHYADLSNRAWIFATAGYGRDAYEWKQFIFALHTAGYDHVLSIEHEDALMNRKEGFEKSLEFLKSVYVSRPPEKMWWA